MNRKDATSALVALVRENFGEGAVVSINWGDSHRRMLLDNRRHERAYRRSRRNQPPRGRRA